MNLAQILSPAMRWIVGAVLLIEVVWTALYGFSVDWASFLPMLLAGVILVSAGIFYEKKRPTPAIQSMVNMTFFLLLITNLGAVLSYLLTSTALPLQDAHFAMIDNLFGFHWPDYMVWANEHPVVRNFLMLAYQSSMFQIVAMVLILSAMGKFAALIHFSRAYVAAILLTLAISVFIPAMSADAYFAPADNINFYLEHNHGVLRNEVFMGLREGTWRLITMEDVQGLVSFPSFHTCLAMLTAYAMRDHKWLFIGFAALNAVVIIGTISEGGHYLFDLFGGVIVAVFAIAVAHIAQRAESDQPAEIRANPAFSLSGE